MLKKFGPTEICIPGDLITQLLGLVGLDPSSGKIIRHRYILIIVLKCFVVNISKKFIQKWNVNLNRTLNNLFNLFYHLCCYINYTTKTANYLIILIINYSCYLVKYNAV